MKRMKLSTSSGDVFIKVLAESDYEKIFRVYDYEFRIVSKKGDRLDESKFFNVICEGEVAFSGWFDSPYFCFDYMGIYRSDEDMIKAAAMVIAKLY